MSQLTKSFKAPLPSKQSKQSKSFSAPKLKIPLSKQIPAQTFSRTEIALDEAEITIITAVEMPSEASEPRKEHQKPLAKRNNLMGVLAASAGMPMPTAPKKEVVDEVADEDALPTDAGKKAGGTNKPAMNKPAKVSAGMEAAGIVLVGGEWVPAHKAKEVAAQNAKAEAAAKAALAPDPEADPAPAADKVVAEETTDATEEKGGLTEEVAEEPVEAKVVEEPVEAKETKVVPRVPPKPPSAVTVVDTRLEELACQSPLALFECLELVLNDPDPQKSVVKESALVIIWKLSERCEQAKAQSLDEGSSAASTAGAGAGIGAGLLSPALCEPRIVKLLPHALRCLGSHKKKEKRVQAAALGACTAAIKMCGAHSLTAILVPQLLEMMDGGGGGACQWQTVATSCTLLMTLLRTHCFDDEGKVLESDSAMLLALAGLLPKVVPVTAQLLTNTKKQVVEAAYSVIESIFAMVDNVDVAPLLPALLRSMTKTDEVPECIQTLASTTFVQTVTLSTLCVIVPLLVKGFHGAGQDHKRTSVKRQCALIVANMTKLVDEPQEALPFLPQMRPLLINAADQIADAEARNVCEEARAQLDRIQRSANDAASKIGGKSSKDKKAPKNQQLVVAAAAPAAPDTKKKKGFDITGYAFNEEHLKVRAGKRKVGVFAEEDNSGFVSLRERRKDDGSSAGDVSDAAFRADSKWCYKALQSVLGVAVPKTPKASESPRNNGRGRDNDRRGGRKVTATMSGGRVKGGKNRGGSSSSSGGSSGGNSGGSEKGSENAKEPLVQPVDPILRTLVPSRSSGGGGVCGTAEQGLEASACLKYASLLFCSLIESGIVAVNEYHHTLHPFLLPFVEAAPSGKGKASVSAAALGSTQHQGQLLAATLLVCQDLVAKVLNETPPGFRDRSGLDDDDDEDDGAELLCDCKFTLAFGTKILLHNTKMKLKRGYRYGLLGGNDSGKTTLMRSIANEQVEGFPPSSEVRTVFVEADISPDDSDLTCVQYVMKNERIKAYGIKENKVREILQAVGFVLKKDGKYAAQDDPVDELSGGWRMKLALATAMLQNADILLLDEPTNHLDVINVKWVLDYLKNLKNVTSIIVSHDSKLLDEVCTHIIQIDRLKLNMFRGNLTAFAEKVPEAKSYFEFRASAKNKMIFPQPGYIEGIKSKGKALMKMAKVEFTYPTNDTPTLFDISVQVSLASRVACIGRNGAGKSTLVKLLTGEMEPQVGEVWQHPGCRVAYVAQHAFHHIEQHLKLTANEYIRWRYQYGEDKEAVAKASMKLTDEEEKAMKQQWDHEQTDEKGNVKVTKRVVKRLTMARRHNKDERSDEYEVVWEGGLTNTWELGDPLCKKGWGKIVKQIDVKEAAKAGQYTRPLTQTNVEEHLANVGLAAEFGTHNRMSQLSGGQKVKVVLGAAMWNQPHIVILDEPTNYLDRESLGALAGAIEVFEGGVVMITHNNAFCQQLCPETWLMQDGHLDCQGDADWMDKAANQEVDVVQISEMVDGAGNVIKLAGGVNDKPLDRKEKTALMKLLRQKKKAGEDTYDIEERLGLV
jgi:ATPase subunit of ABC transporter with duplicated ATPase domains